MIYSVLVTILNSPTKVRKWGYLIDADTRETAKEKALTKAIAKASKSYSRYKKCSFDVKSEDIEIFFE